MTIPSLLRSPLVLLLLMAAPQLANADPTYLLSNAQDEVVLRYSRTPAELDAPDPSTLVTVYASGKAVISFPSVSPRKGNWVVQLEMQELQSLVADLVTNRVMEFNAQTLGNPPAVMIPGSSGQGMVEQRTYVADADLTRFQLRLEQYSPDPATTISNAEHDVSVRGLQFEQQRFSSNSALESLARVERQLVELTDSDRLERLP